MPDTPPSTYKMGSWTVTRLRDELRSRNLSPVGNKPQLVERLAHANSESGTTPISVRIRRSGKYILWLNLISMIDHPLLKLSLIVHLKERVPPR